MHMENIYKGSLRKSSEQVVCKKKYLFKNKYMIQQRSFCYRQLYLTTFQCHIGSFLNLFQLQSLPQISQENKNDICESRHLFPNIYNVCDAVNNLSSTLSGTISIAGKSENIYNAGYRSIPAILSNIWREG